MASTYTPNAAIAYCKSMVKAIPIDQIAATACDMVNSMLWTFYPWRWSKSSLTPITCSDGVQDYVPTDTNILRPVALRLVRTDVTPNEYRELGLLANLSPELTRTGGLETIRAAGWYPAGNFIRLALAASVSSPQVLQIQGEYQTTPTKITQPGLNTVFAFPDHFFMVFVAGLLWQCYVLSDDPRAGAVQYQKNGTQMKVYTGQLGLFMDLMLQMARTEDLGAGDEFQWPDNPLGVGRSYWPGLYGL